MSVESSYFEADYFQGIMDYGPRNKGFKMKQIWNFWAEHGRQIFFDYN